jgi:hypothetical protein
MRRSRKKRMWRRRGKRIMRRRNEQSVPLWGTEVPIWG